MAKSMAGETEKQGARAIPGSGTDPPLGRDQNLAYWDLEFRPVQQPGLGEGAGMDARDWSDSPNLTSQPGRHLPFDFVLEVTPICECLCRCDSHFCH